MYSYNEALEASIQYFNGDELPAKVFLDKYALRDTENNIIEKTPEDMHRRLAKEFARIEAKKYKIPFTEEQIFLLFDKFKYIIPQGSPMYGIGNPYQIVSLSNCYVLETPEDSYNSILDVDKQLVNISKRRGGVGIDLSKLRPKGFRTNNAARTTTGVVSWMDRYSNSIREVGQGGRRGALMLTLDVHHPDILDFITIKNDPSKVTGANISVRLSKEFLQAVKDNTEYEVRFPIENPKFTKKISANEVWNTIIHSAWLRAEPGLLMWDNVLSGPADVYVPSVSTNPCQPAWAKVITQEGIKEFKDIDVGSQIWSSEGWTTVTKKWSTGTNKVYKYTTTSGIFYGTENHKLVSNGEKIEAKDCESIDIIIGPDTASNINFQDVMDGLVIGDGSVHTASNNLVHLNIGANDSDYFNDMDLYIVKHRPGLSDYAYEVDTTISYDELPLLPIRTIPDRFFEKKRICGFLRGLYSANGSVCDNRITLKSSCFKLIEQVQLMLNSIGIRSYYTTNKTKEVEFSNGCYTCKESYDLNISTDREKFVKNIGFIQQYKNEKIQLVKSSRVKTTYDIVSVDFISQEETFDITVDNSSHTYWTQGCNVSNCSELPLPSYDSCRLLVLNLLSFVENAFTEKAYFNYKKFYNFAQIAQRLMDDLVDLESEAIQRIINKIESDPESDKTKLVELELWKKIKETNDSHRRTGTGITALGDTLAAINVKYGSDKSIDVTEDIYKVLKFGCYQSSVDIAKELGTFHGWSHVTDEKCEFITRFQNESFTSHYGESFHISGKLIYNNMRLYGRRNIALITTAPTGSVSIETQTTSGIEPLFRLEPYTRRKKVNPGDKHARIDFVDANGDSWQEFDVYHSQLKKWMDINEETDWKLSPWYGACAEDIDWIQRVKLQAVAQKHVCHAISSTINLPEDVSEATVAEIYKTSFENGLKGITIYRNNCRTGVLVDKKEEAKPVIEVRPKSLKCDVHHITAKGQSYFILVGIHNGHPYEVFAGKNGFIPKAIKTGKIIKKSSGYKVEFDDSDLELSPITASMDEMEEVISRLTSGILRSGVDMHFVVQQLEKVGERQSDLNSFARSVARVLKKYIPDGTKEGEKCPECKGELIRQEGCKRCVNPDCGFSACM